MNEEFFASLNNFSLTKSGIFNRLLVRFGMDDDMKYGFRKRSLVISGVAWLPLLLLSLMQGVAYGHKVEFPFWKDFFIHIRFLLIIPMLVYAEGVFDRRHKQITAQFFLSGILNENDQPLFEDIKKRMLRLGESKAAALVIIAIVSANIAVRLLIAKAGNLDVWAFLKEGDTTVLSWAGIYFTLVSIPVFQYLILQWLWRWVVWFIYLKNISNMKLKLNPAHPDLAGGLGFLGFPPGPFILVNAALSITISAYIAQRIVFMQDKLADYYIAMGVFAFFSIVINVLPLLVFLKTLAFHRRRGYFQYSALVQEHHREFDDKWLGKPVEEEIRGFSDASALTDFNTTFDTVNQMRFIPFNTKIMISSIAIAILPMLPVFAFEYNIVDLLIKVLGMLF